MIEIKVEIRDRGVKELLARLQNKIADLRPAMKSIGAAIRTSVIRNFEAGGRPAWVPSKKKGGKTLIGRGRLMNSIIPRDSADRVTIGTNIRYAAIHQFGGQTPARIITPRYKRALFWPGARHPVKSVRHPGSRIPARPFLMIQDEDWGGIRKILERHILERQA